MLELVNVELVSDRQLESQKYEQKYDDSQPSAQRALIHSGDYSRLSQTPIDYTLRVAALIGVKSRTSATPMDGDPMISSPARDLVASRLIPAIPC